MAESLAYAISQAFSLTGTQTASVTDDDGTRSVDFNAAGTTWARVGLADTSGAATEADPVEFLSHVQSVLNGSGSLWAVKLRTDGRVRITYAGASVTGTITWTGGVQTILGGFGAVSLAPGATEVAPYQPTHVVYGVAVSADTGWQRVSSRFAGVAMPDGKVYGWGDGFQALERRAGLHLHPKDDATRQAAGFPDVMPGTPMFPTATARWMRPGVGEPTQAPPWSVLDFLGTAGGKSLGVTWGDYQGLVSGSVTTFDICYLAPDSVRGAKPGPSVALLDARWSVPDVVFTFAGPGTL